MSLGCIFLIKKRPVHGDWWSKDRTSGIVVSATKNCCFTCPNFCCFLPVRESINFLYDFKIKPEIPELLSSPCHLSPVGSLFSSSQTRHWLSFLLCFCFIWMVFRLMSCSKCYGIVVSFSIAVLLFVESATNVIIPLSLVCTRGIHSV